ncbi:MAG: 50S ribosomal protein L24 [Candidatus Magasanikbacteria bacterium GW2011_GWA2_50_22]|uniref:Large ribosomal subunit protein uL24 n=1 Tax=Candidatus Magasanikbacteria bacterium GW2011_GWA2_50_22 TaxID=1619043 RepID=A0A0G1WG87_9BACT|nr:MAG: 50S ribosomal protein L24 [Candidatus Magasanikbacteria bacterium GW2011_GWA2_50_22]
MIMSGKEAGKSGKVIQVFPEEGKVVVEGLHQMKKHLRAKSSTEKGQILTLASPLPVAKVMLICPKCDQPVRVGYQLDGEKKQRACRRCHQVIV